jgi:hypothetical protein
MWTYVDRADEVLVLREDMGQANAPQDSEEPCAEESLPCLFGRDLDKRCASEGNTTEVSKDVVGNDHGDGQDEPDEAFKNVVDDKVRLSDNEEEGHVRPGKLSELEFVVALLQGEDEEDEACCCQCCNLLDVA